MNYYEFLTSQLHSVCPFFSYALQKLLEFHSFLFIKGLLYELTTLFSFSPQFSEPQFNITLLLAQKQCELDWRAQSWVLFFLYFLFSCSQNKATEKHSVWRYLLESRLSCNFPVIWMKNLCDSLTSSLSTNVADGGRRRANRRRGYDETAQEKWWWYSTMWKELFGWKQDIKALLFVPLLNLSSCWKKSIADVEEMEFHPSHSVILPHILRSVNKQHKFHHLVLYDVREKKAL